MHGRLPQDSRHVMRATQVRQSWKSPAYNHLNVRIDQLNDLDWDFRFYYWDFAWGWEWSTYFAQALGSVIGDMARAPTTLLLSYPNCILESPAAGEPGVNGKRKGD